MITSADMLLVMPEERRTLSRKELNLYGLAWSKGDLSVKIYDMQYSKADVSPSMELAEISQLHPAMLLAGTDDGSDTGPACDDDLDPNDGEAETAANAGAYLIRASLEIDGVRKGTIDLAVVENGWSP